MSGLLTRALAHSWYSINVHGMNTFLNRNLEDHCQALSLGAPHQSTLEGNIRHSTAPDREIGPERERSALARTYNVAPWARIRTVALPLPCEKTESQRGEGTRPRLHSLGPLLCR